MSVVGRGYGFIPTQINGCVLWLRADQVALSGTTVTSVTSLIDLSGNGNSLSTAHNNFPTYVPSDANLNGCPSLAFLNASTQGIQNASISVPQPFSIFVVGYTPPGGGTNLLAFCRTTDSNLYFTAGNNSYSNTAGGSVSIASTATASAVCSVCNGAASRNYGNSSNNSATFNTANNLSGLALGLITGVNQYNCNFGEVIVYNQALSPAQVSYVFRYLGARYAQAWQ